MAVSSVLNGSKSSVRISEDTKRRIKEAAAKLKYRPNVAARALVNRRMNAIGAVIVMEGEELNHYFLEVFNGIVKGANLHNQNVTVFTLKTWKDAIQQLERAFDGRIDGMILIAPVVTEEFAKGLDPHMPCVSLHANALIDGVLNLESDEEEGAYQMVKALVDKGHRRIMHFSGPRGLIGAERRIKGYLRALEEGGIDFEEDLLKSMEFRDVEAKRVATEWLANHSKEQLPDAIFCANDHMAFGCIEALSNVGIRVPEDVSVCGFDDTLVARVAMPTLTTVRQPLNEMGAEAVSILMKRIADESSEKEKPKHIVFPTELIERNSTSAR